MGADRRALVLPQAHQALSIVAACVVAISQTPTAFRAAGQRSQAERTVMPPTGRTHLPMTARRGIILRVRAERADIDRVRLSMTYAEAVAVRSC